MAGKQSVGGGGRKIGNHKLHCAKYKTLGIRLRNKIRNFTTISGKALAFRHGMKASISLYFF